MIDWIQNNYIEILGAITGIIFLYLEIKQNIWLWPFGLITSALYVYIFFTTKFYADMGLQFYYLIISIYGWWNWLYGSQKQETNSLPVTHITTRQIFNLSLVTVAIFAGLVYVLKNFTDSPVPIGDSFTTALSIIATWMLARKILEMWWVWIIVNGVALALYIYKGMYPTSVLFFFYFALSFAGYVQWEKSMKSETSNNATTEN